MKQIISALTDTEFCLLEQLAYLDEDVAEAASDENFRIDFYKISGTNIGQTIAKILAPFDEKALAKLRTHTGSVCSAEVSGVEWARIIKFLKDGRTASLVLEDLMIDENGYHSATAHDGKMYNYPLALCFSNGTGSSDEAVVVFKGTTGPKEWADNVRAANVFDTPPQRKALEFVEKAAERFEKVSTIGHSKGSNKAMYSALMCDKVVRCVGFDGQGFSRVFLETPEVAERIKNRAGLIKNYSLTGDFVHILLYQIPDSHQLFCKGYCVNSVGENHSPNSFFQQSSDGNDESIGSQTIMVGNTSYIIPRFEVSSENESVETLHSFVDYLLSKDENVDRIIEYLAKLLPIVIVGEDEDGNKYDSKAKLKAVVDDTESLTAIITNLTSFVKENKLNGEYVDSLLAAFGINDGGIFSKLFKLKK
jgi:hypothetical protein